MHLEPGVLVSKRGRSGRDRQVHVRYVKLNSAVGNGGFGITWRSARLGLRRTFDLSRLCLVSNEAATTAATVSNTTATATATSASSGAEEDGFVVLTNPSRRLLLKFPGELRAYFLHHMNSLCPYSSSSGYASDASA